MRLRACAIRTSSAPIGSPPPAAYSVTTPQPSGINALCAYLRRPDKPDLGDDPVHADLRHAIIRLFRKHLQDDAAVSGQDHDFDFTDVVFGSASFQGATFTGHRVRFTNARFSGGEINFKDATFSGHTIIYEDAAFSGDRIGFNNASFI